jgi:hypothetical protein
MNAEARTHLQQLLEGQRVLSLAVVVDGGPHIGLLPFAVLPDHSGVLVHVSALAKHTQGLTEGAAVAVLVHQSEEAVGKPLEVPRVSMQATAEELRRGRPEYDEAKALYLSRFPEAAVTFALGDFKLIELRFVDGRFVEGFARAADISQEDLKAMTPPEKPRTDKKPGTSQFWNIPRD